MSRCKTLSKHTDESTSPIRRIGKDEKKPHRQWPDKKRLASSQNIPQPKPGEKNRIHSVLVALPVLMLMIGLFVYFKGESAQNNGAPVISELVNRTGQFKSVSEVSGIGRAKYYLWYTVDGNSKGVRINAEQKAILGVLEAGDELTLALTPRVAGSATLWAYRVHHDGVDLVVPPSTPNE